MFGNKNKRKAGQFSGRTDPLEPFNPLDGLESELMKIDSFLTTSRIVCEANKIRDPAIAARRIAIRKGFFSDIEDFRRTVIETKELIYSAIEDAAERQIAITDLDSEAKELIGKEFRALTLTFDRDLYTPRTA